MNLLTNVLRDPALVGAWRAEHWNSFLPLARRAGLMGRCLEVFESNGLLDLVPDRLVDQFKGTLAQTRYVQVQALRELNQVARVLGSEDIPLIALKGVAYLAAGLPPRGWRSLSDIDLLVRSQDLLRAEQALQRTGWQLHGDFDGYDQRYYREWMHEIPPMIHSQRETEVDIHHNLAPPVSRVRIDADKLWRDAVLFQLEDRRAVRVLSGPDILLHNAVHLFMNDELRGGLRDVVDFRDLYRHFVSENADFDQELVVRARELNCERPLYYAATTARRLAGLELSDTFINALRPFAPMWPFASIMHWLIERVLAPERLGMTSTTIANWLLFVRSHWVRMPPGLLIKHLWHKALFSKKPVTPDADLPG